MPRATKKKSVSPPRIGRVMAAFLWSHAVMTMTMMMMTMLTPAVRGSAPVVYSYDPSSSVGPEFWKDLVMDSNQCGGISNSPIALESQQCTTFADYTFTVRCARRNGAADAHKET
jgi:carbonic anhydrase